MSHTPGPWKWQGEDYRGDWGWAILVGPNGEGLIVGQEPNGGSCKHLRVGMPVDSALCITGLASEGKERVESVHVFSQANARLIATAPQLLEALKSLHQAVAGTLQGYGILEGPMNFAGEAIAKAEGAATPLQRETKEGS